MILKNNRHERFAQLLAEGKSQADAYREVFPASRRWKDTSLHPKASALTDKVSTRVRELQKEGIEQAIMTRNEACIFLSRVIRTPICEVDEKSDLCQEVALGNGTKRIKMASKIEALVQLARIMGWYEAEKQDHTYRFEPDSRVLCLLEAEAAKDDDG